MNKLKTTYNYLLEKAGAWWAGLCCWSLSLADVIQYIQFTTALLGFFFMAVQIIYWWKHRNNNNNG